ncbi:MAG: hypothetical protein RL556_600 [Actinomycetota bacterium]|jgi:1-acyl-sn-glycerol-3-phosphate acyltransferase
MAKAKKLDALAMPDFSKAERNFDVAVVANLIGPIIRLIFGLRIRGAKKLPKSGPYIVVSNHLTKLDALAIAYFMYFKVKRTPHFLAKEGLFRLPVVGQLLINAGQIPVYRSAGQKNDEPLRAAYECLRQGGVITIFPEGTLTREPNLWPMRGRSGAVRLAVEGNVPVFPVGHWGDQDIMDVYGTRINGGFWKKVDILVGDEIDLRKYRGHKVSTAELAQATEDVMRAITKQVEELRGEKAPEVLYDPVVHGQKAVGNFVRKTKAEKQAEKKAKAK